MRKILWVMLLTATNFIYSNDLVELNFNNVEIKVLIDFIGELSGKSVISDQLVEGKISLFSQTKLNYDDAKELIFATLDVYGYGYLETDKYIKILAKEKLKSNSMNISSGKTQEHIFPGQLVTHIVQLEFVKVEELKPILLSLMDVNSSLNIFTQKNILMITDESQHIQSLLKVISYLDDVHQKRKKIAKVYKLHHVSSDQVFDMLNKLYHDDNAMKKFQNQNDDIQFVSSAKSNQLVVLADQAMQNEIADLLQSLDQRKKQIMVEVLIAEVSEGETLNWGIDWVTAEGVVYGTPNGYGVNSITGAKQVADLVLSGKQSQGYQAGFVYDTKNIAGIDFPRLGSIIHAFKENEDVNILSTPQILTMDHEEAEILVGENRAFIQNTQVTAEGGTVRTFEFRDIGLLLRIKPHIVDNDHVEVDIYQKTEDVIGQSFEGAVETSKRETKTKVLLKDHQIAVIGGLIKNQEKDRVHKVPILGDIPLLGLAFQNKDKVDSKVNLLIFLSPHILDDQEELDQLTQDKSNEYGINIKK